MAQQILDMLKVYSGGIKHWEKSLIVRQKCKSKVQISQGRIK